MVRLVQPLCRSVEPCEIEQKSPRTNPEQCRLPPGYPKYAGDSFAIGPLVFNPVFCFASGRVDFAPRTSPVRAFFRAPIDVRGLRTFARQFPRAVAASLHVSVARVPTRAVRAGGLFPHSKEQNSNAALYVHCRSFARVRKNGWTCSTVLQIPNLNYYFPPPPCDTS